MSGPAPKEDRRRRNVPARGDWQQTETTGWQGEIPAPPTKLTSASRLTWSTWFGAWYAAHWGPEDLPLLRQLIRLYDRIERGEGNTGDRAELRQMADSFGITKKGQQDRRWSAPKAEPLPTTATGSHYGHLRVAK